jgi:hypothetical protein
VRACSPEDGKALCQWEHTAGGDLIARWQRGSRESPDLMPRGLATRRAHSGADRRRMGRSGRAPSERLTRVAVIVTMYLVTGFGIFPVFVAPSTPDSYQSRGGFN